MLPVSIQINVKLLVKIISNSYFLLSKAYLEPPPSSLNNAPKLITSLSTLPLVRYVINV